MNVFVLCDENGKAVLFGNKEEMELLGSAAPGSEVRPTRISFSLTEKIVGFKHVQPGVLIPVN